MANDEQTHRIVDTHTLHSGWAKFLLVTIQLPDGHRLKREVEDHGDAVSVLPYHATRRTAVLVRQWRAPPFLATQQGQTLEVIAGCVEKNEEPIDCVRREAVEEADLKLDALEHVFTGWTMPGISTERMHFYLAPYSGPARGEINAGTDEDEDTLAIEIGLADLAHLADTNALPDVKTLLLVQTLRLRKPDLFEKF